MGADFVEAKPVPVHTGDQEAAQKETSFSFFFDTGIIGGFVTRQKVGLKTTKDAVKFKEGATSQKHCKAPGVAPGDLLHGDQLASALTLDELSSSSSSLKELVLRPLLSLSAQHSIRPPEER